MPRPFPVLAASCLALASFASAGGCQLAGETAQATPQRPRFASNAFTTAPGTFELQSGVSLGTASRVDSPVRLKFGQESGEVFVGWSPYVEFAGEAGIGDVQVGTRQALGGQAGDARRYAFSSSVTLPTAEVGTGRGVDETAVHLAGIVTQSAPRLILNGAWQLGLLGETAQGGLDLEHALAAGLTSAFAPHASFFTELALILTPERDFERVVATVGLAWSAHPSLVFDLGLAFSYDDREDFPEDDAEAALLFGVTQNFGLIRALRQGPGSR